MIPSSHILAVRDSLAYVQTDQVYLFIPVRTACVEVGCGPNPATGGALDPSCAVCGGTGYTETLMPSLLRCRVKWWIGPDATYSANSGFMAGEVGDLTLSFAPMYQDVIERALANSKSYVTVDGQRAKMHTVTPARMSGVVTSLDVQCNLTREERDGQRNGED